MEPSFATVFLSEKKKWGWGWDSSCQDPPSSDHAGTALPSSGKEVLLERKDIGIVTKFLKGGGNTGLHDLQTTTAYCVCMCLGESFV